MAAEEPRAGGGLLAAAVGGDREALAQIVCATRPDMARLSYLIAGADNESVSRRVHPMRLSGRSSARYLAAASLALMLVLTGCALLTLPRVMPTGSSNPGYSVSGLPGIQPQLTAAEVADMVMQQLQKNAAAAPDLAVPIQVVSVEATTMDKAVEETNGFRSSGSNSSVVWLVRARGPFLAHFGPPGQARASSPEGFYVIDDRTGVIWSMGFQPIPTAAT